MYFYLFLWQKRNPANLYKHKANQGKAIERIKVKQSSKKRLWHNHAQKKRELKLITCKLNLNWRRTKSKVVEIIKQIKWKKKKNETLYMKRTKELGLIINDP